ncbi:MAG: complex I NDUFA9 subunit family protein [Dehalococcoidia bacterium]
MTRPDLFVTLVPLLANWGGWFDFIEGGKMILVTGATGYVGRRVVRKLAEEGESVRCLVRPSSDLSPFQGLEVETHVGDVKDLSSLRSACDGADSVVHLVAIIRERGENTFDRVNHLGTENVVKAAVEAGVDRFVHLGAIGAGNDVRYPYLYSKWQGEQAVMSGGIPYVVLRSSIMFGRGDEFINALAAVVKLGPVTPIIGAGRTKFQPIFVEDVAVCISQALKDEGLLGRVTEIGGPEQLTYKEMVDLIISTYGARRLKIRIPVFAIKPLMPMLGRLLPHPPITRAELDMINLDNLTELDSVEKSFGFKPRPLRDNMEYILDMARWEAAAIALGFRPARRW